MDNDKLDFYIKKIKETDDLVYKAKVIDLLLNKGIKQRKVANLLSLKPSYLSHIRRLLNLPDIILDGYYNKTLSKSHLFALSRLSKERSIELYEQILTEGLSVHETERKIREFKYKFKDEGEYISKDDKSRFVEHLRKKFPKASFSIYQSRREGNLKIKISGNLRETTGYLKRIISKLLS